VYLEDFKDEKLTPRANKTRWATRGWTLQEVVICKHAVVYNKKWGIVADTREDNVQGEELADVCHIPKELLCSGGKPDVAASLVLQHAARRTTLSDFLEVIFTLLEEILIGGLANRKTVPTR
jgi:hypothetical protein